MCPSQQAQSIKLYVTHQITQHYQSHEVKTTVHNADSFHTGHANPQQMDNKEVRNKKKLTNEQHK